ncbi:hypothetical protein [Kurthia zopfii]|uniref:hypothetical protein n=1 Tax=Kurthia zopfii TaxID=1650 RepID=UPI000F6F8035|nr:hypothetical protein [Kurthia zopfii]VEI07994.1 Uncharacterised protein [Kurthia zopfii]
MTKKRSKKKSAFMKTWLVPSILLVITLLITGMIVYKIIDSNDSNANSPKQNGSKITSMAKKSIATYRQSLEQYATDQYKINLERYNQLSTTEKAAFDVEKITNSQVNASIQKQIGKSIFDDSFEKTDGLQPTTKTTVQLSANQDRYEVVSTATLGEKHSTVKQQFKVDFQVDQKIISDFYRPQYVAHTSKRIAIQNASNVLGLLASSNVKNITVDGSSCQHELRNGAYLNECLNDGNTTASNSKIMNDLSFQKFLPSFPTKEIKALDEAGINDEKLYFKKKIKDQKKKVKIYYLKDGQLTVDHLTKKKFTESNPFQFTSTETHLSSLSIDGEEAFIDIGDHSQTLRIDQLRLTGNAKLHFVGSGKVQLFIQSFSATDGSIIADGAKLATFYDSKAPITFSKNFTSDGFIYLKNADATLMMDTYKGNIISGGQHLLIDGGASPQSQFIVLPKGNLELTNRTSFKGSMIANAIVINQSSVTFAQPSELLRFPIQYPVYQEVRQYVLYSKLQEN